MYLLVEAAVRWDAVVVLLECLLEIKEESDD